MGGRHNVRHARYIHKYKCEDFMEYAVDIYKWKKSLETSYLAGDWTEVQTDVTPPMRHSLLMWLLDYVRQVEFSLETWCLAVNYLDRFLCAQLIAKDCLQLTGLTALWVAGKQGEVCPLHTEELASLCAATYSKINFLQMEMVLLAKLKFRLAAPTPAYLLSLLVEMMEDQEDWSEDLATHLLEMVMAEHSLARREPSRIANSVFSVLKLADTESLRVVEASCPQCEPHNSDEFCRNFLSTCFSRVCHLLSQY